MHGGLVRKTWIAWLLWMLMTCAKGEGTTPVIKHVTPQQAELAIRESIAGTGYPTPTAIVCKLVPGDKAVDVQLSWKVLEGNTTVPSSRFYVDVCRDGQCDTFPVFKGHELTLKGLQFWALYNLTVYCLNRETGGANLEIYTGPGAPTEVRDLTVRDLRLNVVTYSWTRPETPRGNLDGYIVTTTNLEDGDIYVDNVSGNVTGLTRHLDEQYTNYSVSVQAYNVIGPYKLRKAGPAVSRTFRSPGEGLIPPRATITSIGVHHVDLTWTKPEEEDRNVFGYRVEVDSGSQLFTRRPNATLGGLMTWTRYAVFVASCSSTYDCGPFKAVKFRTDADAPSAPVLLNGTSAGKHWINIVWAAPKEPNGPVDGYNVTWHNSGHRCESVVVQTTTVNLTSLALNSLYEIKVSAFNNGLRVRKPGPPVELSIRTLSNGPSPPYLMWPSTIAVTIVIPAVCLVLVLAYYSYTRIIRRREEDALLGSVDEAREDTREDSVKIGVDERET